MLYIPGCTCNGRVRASQVGVATLNLALPAPPVSSQGGVVKKCLCNERVGPVHYVAIDDLVITTPLRKRYNRPLDYALVKPVHLC